MNVLIKKAGCRYGGKLLKPGATITIKETKLPPLWKGLAEEVTPDKKEK